MDVDLLSGMIKELVTDNDSVTLPGLGCFVAELVPATFADRGYTIQPPYRRLYFSPRSGEDNLLVSLYARDNNLSEQDAEASLVQFLQELKEVLKEKKSIVLPGLGRLRATMENHFFFVADEDLDIYPEGFGLEPVSLKTHTDEPKADVPADAPQEEPSALPQEPVVVEEPQADAPQEEPSVPKKKSGGKTFWKIVLWIGIIAVVALAAIAILGRVAPEWLDTLLYSPEELEILK